MKSKFVRMIGGQVDKENNDDSHILPSVSDDQIDNIYLEMIPLDGKFASFTGSKREYVATVYLKMKQFLEQSNLMGSGLPKKAPVKKAPVKKAPVEEAPVEDTQEEKDTRGVRLDELYKKNEKIGLTVEEAEEFKALKQVFRDAVGVRLSRFRSAGVDVPAQDILDLVKKFKVETAPLEELVGAEDKLLQCVAFPLLGFAELGNELTITATKERYEFIKKYGTGTGTGIVPEAGFLAEVLVKNHIPELANFEIKELELFKQNVLPQYRFDGIDGYYKKDTIEIKASFNNNDNYTSGHKLALQLLFKKRFPKSTHKHILSKSELTFSKFNTNFAKNPNELKNKTKIYEFNIASVEEYLSVDTKKKIDDLYKDKNVSQYNTPKDIEQYFMEKKNINGRSIFINLRFIHTLGGFITTDLINKGIMEKNEGDSKDYYTFTDYAYNKETNFMTELKLK